MNSLHEIIDSLSHLLFPHTCDGCGSDLVATHSSLCLRCIESLPLTNFEYYPGNPVEKRFYGRLPIDHATAQFYFTKGSLLARLVHQVKYKGNQQLGLQLGKMMGDSLKRSGRFDADMIIPLPLFPLKEKKRGYNQADLLCEGIAEYLHLPIVKNVIIRPQHTDTQTSKGRIERWKNIEGKFVLTDPSIINGKHILLVDDVITTGATLESCGSGLLQIANSRLSIACLGHSFS